VIYKAPTSIKNQGAIINMVLSCTVFESFDVEQEAQLSLTNCASLFCKVVEVLQDFLSENVDKKFTTDYNAA